MAKQVVWTKCIVDTFIDEAMLNEEEQAILRTRVAGWSRTKQADELGMSVSSVDRIISRLKVKYDHVQRYNSNLPPRGESIEDIY